MNCAPALPTARLGRRACLGSVAAACMPQARASSALVLRYGRLALLPEDLRLNFALTVLRDALATQGIDASFVPSELTMERPRAFRALVEGQIDFTWAALNDEAEAQLRPIYVPLFRGLTGKRLFLIHRDNEARFAKVRQLSDLAEFTAGQGVGWVDTPILKAAGLKVVSNTYEALFRMVVHRKIDYFPRGVLEAVGELTLRGADLPELMVEPRLMLSYRSDQIFYVRRGNEALAAPIEAGLKELHESGAYKRLWDSHPFVQQGLRGAQLERRLRLNIPNPMLSEAARAIPERYWG